MKNSHLLLSVCAMSLQVLASCKEPESKLPTTETTGATTEHSAPVGTAQLSATDKEFGLAAAESNLLQIQLGRHVAIRSSSKDVKNFADRMATEHSRAQDELRAILLKKGLTAPSELKPEHREEITELAGYTGQKLDKEYLEEVIKEHRKEIDAFTRASISLTDPELRQWSKTTLATLEHHLNAARELMLKLTP